jgi:hypothetical protein
MRRFWVVLLAASAGIAFAKPAFVTVKDGTTTLSVPKGYKAAVGENCISVDGDGSLYVFRTSASLDDFEKAEAPRKGKRVASDKAVCFELTKPGENARCMITTDDGRWITQFVSFGKKYSAIGGAAAMQTIVTSIKGWNGKPYDGLFPASSDCPVVKL